MSNEKDFELIAITRDLARKPEVRFLAQVLAKINNPSSTRAVEQIDPALVKLAYNLVSKPQHRETLLSAIGIII